MHRDRVAPHLADKPLHFGGIGLVEVPREADVHSGIRERKDDGAADPSFAPRHHGGTIRHDVERRMKSLPRLALWTPRGANETFAPQTPFGDFQRALRAEGGDLQRLDVYERRGESPDVVIFLEVERTSPQDLLRAHPGAIPWLILLEGPVVRPLNGDRRRHAAFSRIFSWDDDLVERLGYVKFNYPHPLAALPSPEPERRPRFCTLIASNKCSPHPQEIYSHRLATIRWYEKHHPELFDLYGHGWDGAPARADPQRTLSRRVRDRVRRELQAGMRRPSWRGATDYDHKLAVLRGYRFAICYENAEGFPGYVTEKLLDCFVAGTVAVYRGPPNISEIVPAGSYVDRRAFGSHAELHEHLVSMPEERRREIAEAGRAFLRGPDAEQFSYGFFVRTMMDEVRHLAAGSG
jgi:hypothetical protein